MLALPPVLRCTGTAPEPRIEGADRCFWGEGPAGMQMSEGFARTCGQGGLKQWVRSACLREEDGGSAPFRVALQRLQGGIVEETGLPIEEVEGSRRWRQRSSLTEE